MCVGTVVVVAVGWVVMGGAAGGVGVEDTIVSIVVVLTVVLVLVIAFVVVVGGMDVQCVVALSITVDVGAGVVNRS